MPQKLETDLKDLNFAIFEPHRDFATNPTLVALTAKLAEHGANVDLFCPAFGGYPGLDIDIKRYPFPYPLRLWCYGLKSSLRNLAKYILNRAWRAHCILGKKKYDMILGIDSQGVIAARNISHKKCIQYLYVSFEMLFKNELKKRWEIFEKEDEITASQQASMVIIQDKWRAGLLSRENKIPADNFFYIPVAPKNSKIVKTNYLRHRFNIPENKIIVLHSGSFEFWTYAAELIDSLKSWPPDALLVVHTREKPKNNNSYINKLAKSEYENAILSTKPLASREYEDMVSSADIGLVLYKPNPFNKYHQKNIEEIGLSSGKFSTYMKHGLPVICSTQNSYTQLLKDYKFGININRFSEISQAINEIMANYESYRTHSRRLFSEKLDFDLYWNELLVKLLEIITVKK